MNIASARNRLIKLTKSNNFIECGMTAALGLLMIIQRFLTGGYKPVMDDWFLYGDLYTTIPSRVAQFAIPNEKFAIRPAAGFVDCFINAPLFKHLWIAELLVTAALLIGAFLIIKTLRKNNAAGAGFLMCVVCLFPVGLEATYWLAASTRVAYSLLFIGAAIYSLDYYYKTKKIRGLISYSVLGLFAVSFYEPAIVIYIILTLFVLWCGCKEKKDLIPLIILIAQIAAIGLYYILNSDSGEIESRGGFVKQNIWEHTTRISAFLKDILGKYSIAITKHGFKNGLMIILGGHKILKVGIIACLSAIFGLFSALCVKKRKFSCKFLILGIVLLVGGVSLNYLLGSDRIPLRLVFFSYLGIGIIIDELLILLPKTVCKITCGLCVTVLAFIFTVAGIGEVRDYQLTSDFDTHITQQLIDLDTPERISNSHKNTYVFGGQHYYEESKCVSYLDHIRGASGNYADITGCMRHITGTPDTNNIMTFTYGDSQILKPYIDMEGLCSFYNIEYDKTVVRVNIVPDGDNYDVVREDGTSAGKLVKIDDKKFQFFN